MENYHKSKESSYLKYLDENNCMDGQCLKNCPQMVLNGKKMY